MIDDLDYIAVVSHPVVPTLPLRVTREELASPMRASLEHAFRTSRDRRGNGTRYVAVPDPSYRYELIETIPGDGYTAHVLEMTSWRHRATG